MDAFGRTLREVLLAEARAWIAREFGESIAAQWMERADACIARLPRDASLERVLSEVALMKCGGSLGFEVGLSPPTSDSGWIEVQPPHLPRLFRAAVLAWSSPSPFGVMSFWRYAG